MLQIQHHPPRNCVRRFVAVMSLPLLRNHNRSSKLVLCLLASCGTVPSPEARAQFECETAQRPKVESLLLSAYFGLNRSYGPRQYRHMIPIPYCLLPCLRRLLVPSFRRMEKTHRKALHDLLGSWRNERAEEFKTRYFYILPQPEVMNQNAAHLDTE